MSDHKLSEDIREAMNAIIVGGRCGPGMLRDYAVRAAALETRLELAEARLAALQQARFRCHGDDCTLYSPTPEGDSNPLRIETLYALADYCRVDELPERVAEPEPDGSAAGVRGLSLDAPTSYGDALDKAKAAGEDVSAPTRRTEGSEA